MGWGGWRGLFSELSKDNLLTEEKFTADLCVFTLECM